MSRPLVPDEQRKHKRRIRPSTTVAEQLDIPEPTKAEKKRWKPLVDACTSLVLSNDRLDNKAKKAMIRILLPVGWTMHGKLPPEPSKDGKNKLFVVNAESVLLWLYRNKLADHSPSMLYNERRVFWMKVNKLENSLDLILEERYDGVL